LQTETHMIRLCEMLYTSFQRYQTKEGLDIRIELSRAVQASPISAM